MRRLGPTYSADIDSVDHALHFMPLLFALFEFPVTFHVGVDSQLIPNAYFENVPAGDALDLLQMARAHVHCTEITRVYFWANVLLRAQLGEMLS